MALEYNNNIFSFNGKMSRSAYIIYSLVITIIGFRFIYYPSIMALIQSSPQFNELISLLSQNPQNAWIIKELQYIPQSTTVILVIKYALMIPCRLIDIKRIRDIKGRTLSIFENLFVIVVFSLPYIDFFSTLFLSIMKPGDSVVKPELSEKARAHDLWEAKKENALVVGKKLFEEGKISRAEFEEIKNKYKK